MCQACFCIPDYGFKHFHQITCWCRSSLYLYCGKVNSSFWAKNHTRWMLKNSSRMTNVRSYESWFSWMPFLTSLSFFLCLSIVSEYLRPGPEHHEKVARSRTRLLCWFERSDDEFDVSVSLVSRRDPGGVDDIFLFSPDTYTPIDPHHGSIGESCDWMMTELSQYWAQQCVRFPWGHRELTFESLLQVGLPPWGE